MSTSRKKAKTHDAGRGHHSTRTYVRNLLGLGDDPPELRFANLRKMDQIMTEAKAICERRNFPCTGKLDYLEELYPTAQEILGTTQYKEYYDKAEGEDFNLAHWCIQVYRNGAAEAQRRTRRREAAAEAEAEPDSQEAHDETENNIDTGEGYEWSTGGTGRDDEVTRHDWKKTVLND